MGSMKLLITILAALICCSVSAQNGTADTLYIDVPEELRAMKLQTTEYISAGRKDKERFGKKFLGYSFMWTWCYDGEKLDTKKHQELFRKIRNYPYDKIVFNGFVLDRLDMDYSTEGGVIAGLIVGKKPVLIFRREAELVQEFIVRMYNERLYEDYGFLKRYCSPALLEKLQAAYPYDTAETAYAIWLFRSGQQDANPESDGRTTMLDVKADGDRYVYTALDMGWKFSRTMKVSCKDNKITIEDIE